MILIKGTKMKNKITFPYVELYYIPIKYFLENVTKCEIITPSPIIEENLSLGNIYSPQNVCLSFKWQLGNYIDAIRKGANILLSFRGICLNSFFHEVHENVLEDMGYSFKIIDISHHNHLSLKKTYCFAKQMNNKLNIITFIYYLLQGIMILIFMDLFKKYYRENYAKVKEKNKFTNINNQIIHYYSQKKLSFYRIIKNYYYFKKEYKKITLNNDNNILKILLIGNPLTLIDRHINQELETKLLSKEIIVYRGINLSNIILTTQKNSYRKYSNLIIRARKWCKKGIDGIIHVKCSNCLLALNEISILNKISRDYKLPIIFLNYNGDLNNHTNDLQIVSFINEIKEKKTAKQIKEPLK